jgi:hypothetical protein
LILCSELEEKKQFCFETAWIKHLDYLPKISEIWGREISARNVVEKWYIKMINRVKKFLKGWGQNIKSINRRYKTILSEELIKIEKGRRRKPLCFHS